ncbi:EH domain-binding protein 1 [Ataeniobius toweri]|uniref:EH domain-binding protein 1 n=1 Tax=Ataeniobius toweri TaxID=208326 RepID=A0ABU7A2G5_9TELE|nr:EH domain-binding protein 1 [Ataeniobius toweri]
MGGPIYVSAEVKRQKSVPEDLRKADEDRGSLTEADLHRPFEEEKAFKDTSQYVVGELSALESEQRHIDARAARVEKRLRYLMDTGMLQEKKEKHAPWNVPNVVDLPPKILEKATGQGRRNSF